VKQFTVPLLLDPNCSMPKKDAQCVIPELFYYLIYMHITTNPLKMIMSAYHTIKKLGHTIVLKEIQHFVDYLSAISILFSSYFL
jgi:hypothetical protein